MSKIDLTTLLVGAHFRPPAKFVLQGLPTGQVLRLEPDFGNEYDPNAVKVMLYWCDVAADLDPGIDAALAGTGREVEELRTEWREDLEPALFLGFLAKSGGKPLAASNLPGNIEILDALGRDTPGRWARQPIGKLSFNNSNAPMINLVWDKDEA